MMAPMSGERGPIDRSQLEELVNRARTELRQWTDTADNDPGVALLQLFAFVGELLSGSSGHFAAAAHAGVARRKDVEVEVDGHPWQQVTDLAGSGAQDLHFVVSQGDGGASVIEFGDDVRGRRPPSGSTIGVRYRRGGAHSSVLLQQGRVIIDTDTGDEPVPAACGVYRASVLDNADPLMQQRLLVQVPDVSGDEPVWAAACLPLPDSQIRPAVGDEVWIALESCDPSRPIWLGQRITH